MGPDGTELVRLYRRGRSWWGAFNENGRGRRVSLRTPYIADARLSAARIEERLRRAAAGIVESEAVNASRPLQEHVTDFRTTMEARGGTKRHVDETIRYVNEGIVAMAAK